MCACSFIIFLGSKIFSIFADQIQNTSAGALLENQFHLFYAKAQKILFPKYNQKFVDLQFVVISDEKVPEKHFAFQLLSKTDSTPSLTGSQKLGRCPSCKFTTFLFSRN